MTEQEFREFIESNETMELTGSDLKSHVDRFVSAGVNTYKRNNPPPEGVDEILAASKLEHEEALAEKDLEINRLKIDSQVIRECHRRDIPEDFLEDLGVTFDSVESVSERMEKVSARFEQMRTAQTNLDLSRGFKPGVSGAGDRETVADMSPERIQFLESIGELDLVISGE